MTITISKALKEDTTILQENLKNAELNAKVNPIYENRIQSRHRTARETSKVKC